MSLINVIGLGYIGLPTTLIFAKNGIKVVGTDYNTSIVNSLNQGKLSFEEKGLQELFEEAQANGVEFSTEYKKRIHIFSQCQHLILKKVKNWILFM